MSKNLALTLARVKNNGIREGIDAVCEAMALAQAYRLLGNTVYEPNKRGFVSTYKVISVHLSECSILIGWNLLDGIYSNLNGFEISALGKTVFLTREAAEAALKEKECMK